MQAYRIKDAERIFEIAESKRLKRLQWFPLPNKHDGKGFRRLMRRKNGAALYGAWVCMLAVASKCDPRWILADSEGPLTAQDLADKTDVPAALFAEALELLVKPEIGWLVLVELSVETEIAGSAQQFPAVPSVETEIVVTDRQTDITDTSIAERPTDAPPKPEISDPVILEYPLAGDHEHPALWQLKESRLREFKQIYPGINVMGECRSALGWCMTHETRRKTAKGMPAFLNGWLAREQNKSQGSEQTNGNRPNRIVV